ncbi:hypothetical protein ACH4JS_26525 [Streptomyces sp. NPDC017638]|uniref:hypothetical protein n=1 Tax=unclassified Streptomyces TaxID=2593676 RepID=UPI00296724EF|nr:hypothetical protein [Streptomyces sp. SCL15-4]
MTSTTTLTLGGLLVALLILLANLHPWWKGGREMKQLAPFGKGFGAAACAAACPGGLLGWTHTHTGTAANGAGARTSVATSGTTSGSGLTTGQLVGLGMTGAVIAVLAVFLVVLEYKAAAKKDRRRILGGAFVGSNFLLTAGVAGMLAWLPGALNGAGDAVVAAFRGAGVL